MVCVCVSVDRYVCVSLCICTCTCIWVCRCISLTFWMCAKIFYGEFNIMYVYEHFLNLHHIKKNVVLYYSHICIHKYIYPSSSTHPVFQLLLVPRHLINIVIMCIGVCVCVCSVYVGAYSCIIYFCVLSWYTL